MPAVGPVDEPNHCIDRVGLNRVVGQPVAADGAAAATSMDDDHPLLRRVLQRYGFHQPSARRCSVAGQHVEMLGIQTGRAMVAIAPVSQRSDDGIALFADKSGILGGPADGPLLRSLKPASTRRHRVPFDSSREGLRLRRARDRFTAVPLGTAITSASCFTRACCIPGSGPRPRLWISLGHCETGLPTSQQLVSSRPH